jgi:putative SOS response-associated peptidase YedK
MGFEARRRSAPAAMLEMQRQEMHGAMCAGESAARIQEPLILSKCEGMTNMCGRYVSPDDAAIEREFNLVRTEWQFPPSYNVAPTDDVPVVRTKDGQRGGSRMHWGLIPFWAKGVQPKYSTINATVEKLKDAATWRGPWTRGQRCILPGLGFYEWKVQPDGKSKQPFYITLNDQDVFGFAGLWDSSTGPDGVAVYSCTIVTMPANALMTEIHNVKHRMPAILAKEDRDVWLSGTADDAFSVIKQYADTHMVATPVSTRVGSPKNNDAKLIEAMQNEPG